MAVGGQEQDATALQQLLRDSLAASRAGDHATSWRLTSEFGTRYWLSEPPTAGSIEECAEFHVLRAAAADRMELYDDTVTEVRQWRSLAEDAGDTPSAVLALSSLALVAMVVECDDAEITVGLAPSAALLTELAARITDAGDLVAGSDDRHALMCLSLASMAGLTCATSTENTAMRRIFRQLSSQFLTPSAQPHDLALTHAQQLYADGQVIEAAELVNDVLSGLDSSLSPTQAYEAHDLLGYFALTAGDTPEEMDTDGVLHHWRACADLALAIGAPLEGMHRAEQVCQLLNADGDYDAALDLAKRYSDAVKGAPISPALLNVHAVRARSALGAGRPEEAFACATATADWSSLTPDTERTLACLSIATLAAEEISEAGEPIGSVPGFHEDTVVSMLQRAATIHLDRGELIPAAQVIRTAARERCSVGAISQAVELMERALRILDEVPASALSPEHGDGMLTWHIADWNEDMSAIWEMADRTDLAVGYAERAAKFFRDAQDHSGAALNWVSAAELHLEQGDGGACDRALDLAHGELLSLPSPDSTTELEQGISGTATSPAEPGDPGEFGESGDSAAWQGYLALRSLREQ